MSGRITCVYLANSPDFSIPRTAENIDRMGSKWAVIYWDAGNASRVKDARPHVEVAISPFHPPERIMEIYPDPHQYVDAIFANYGGDKRLWWIIGNEIGHSAAWVKYQCGVIRYGVPKGLKFLTGHYNIGLPETEQYIELLELIRTCNEFRDSVVLCFHEGGTAAHLACAGFIGGAPNGIHLMPDPADSRRKIPTQIHPDYTKRENWPTSRYNSDGSEITMWLSGRGEQRVRWLCEQRNLPVPPLAITETAEDWLAALNTDETLNWLSKQPVAPGYTGLQAWRSGAAVMQRDFPDWTVDEAYAHQLVYQDQVIYEGTNVMFVAVFCAYSYPHNGQANWREHDVIYNEHDTKNFYRVIGDYQYGRVIPAIPPIPGGKPAEPPAPPVDDRPLPSENWYPGILRTLSGQPYVNIRLRRDVNSDDLGDIPNGAALYWINLADSNWNAVWYNDVIGFVSTAVATIENYPDPEPPTPEPPADTVTLTTGQWQLLKQRLNEAQDGIELARDVTREVDAGE